MSRNLYKYFQELEKRVNNLETKCKLLEAQNEYLEALLRTKGKSPCPQPDMPWYRCPTVWLDDSDSVTRSPKITCEYKTKLEDDPFVKLMNNTFKLGNDSEYSTK